MPVIQLRRLEWDDIDTVHALVSRRDVVRHMLFPVCSREESEKFLRDSVVESPSDSWRSIVRAVTDRSTGMLVGLCGVVIQGGAEEGEIWYLVHRRAARAKFGGEHGLGDLRRSRRGLSSA